MALDCVVVEILLVAIGTCGFNVETVSSNGREREMSEGCRGSLERMRAWKRKLSQDSHYFVCMQRSDLWGGLSSPSMNESLS